MTSARRVAGKASVAGGAAFAAAVIAVLGSPAAKADVDAGSADPTALVSTAAADPSGATVADLDGFLQDIGLGSLVTNNDFMLATDSTQPIGQWLLETSSIELFNELNGLDESTLTTALIVDFSPAAQDLGDIFNGTGDLATNLSQLAPDITQGFDSYIQAATEIFLSA